MKRRELGAGVGEWMKKVMDWLLGIGLSVVSGLGTDGDSWDGV